MYAADLRVKLLLKKSVAFKRININLNLKKLLVQLS